VELVSNPTARIDSLDILRGFALLGMILVHFHQRMEADAEGIEGLVGWIVWMGVEQKAWATFAILFGAGFAILIQRLEAKHLPVAAFYLRRLLGLFVIGVAVAVFWGFQILMDYAIWGVPLLLLRKLSTATLFTLALLSASAIHLSRIAEGPHEPANERIAERSALREAAAQTSYPVLVRARARSLLGTYRGIDGHFFIPNVNLALFILGLLAVRHGVLVDPRRHVRVIGTAIGAGVLVWAASWWLIPLIPRDATPTPVASAIRSGFGLVTDIWLALAYVGTLLLLLAYRPAWRTRLSFMGWAGRMALTNYILQAALIDAASSPYGLGARVRPYGVVVATAVLFGLQAHLSRLWFSRFRVGPVEWLLRSLTYGRPQPMRILRPQTEAGAATPLL
jgi:uncharacterized protein